MAPDGWKATTLKSVVSLQRGHDLPETERTAGSVPVMGSFGVTGRHNVARCSGPGVTVGRSGASFGVVSYVDQDYWPLNTVLFATDFHGNDERFVYYLLKTIDFTGYNTGSAQPSLNRNHLVNIPVSLPEIREQRAIVQILGSLDDKIEQNRRTSRAVEELARATFKAWFVDFEPVKAKAGGAAGFPGIPAETFAALPDLLVDSPIGPVPEGWAPASLPQLATFLNGLALQKYPARGDGSDLPVIKIAELRKGSSENADAANSDVPAQFVVDDGDLLFSWSGTLEVQRWFGGKGALNQHLFKVTPNRHPLWYVHHAILQHLPDFRAIASSKATTMGHIQRKHLDVALAAVPTDSVLRSADELIGPIYALSAASRIENRMLAALREYLLPKLLTGEVRVQMPARTDGP
jgi:type I restriction enzyme, S subunit